MASEIIGGPGAQVAQLRKQLGNSETMLDAIAFSCPKTTEYLEPHGGIMQRLTRRSLALLVTVILSLLIACSDKPAAPSLSSGGLAPAGTATVAQPAMVSNTPSGDTTLLVSEVTDVRVQPSETGRVVVGSVIGRGFKQGDTVVINGNAQVPTIMGDDKWLTFSFPVEDLNGKEDFSLEILRLPTSERTKPLSVQLRK